MTNLPQAIVVFMIAFAVVIHTAKHGKPRDGYDGPSSLISATIWLVLLYWGGFFAGVLK